MQSQIPFICKRLYEKNLVVGLEGNVSERKKDSVIITASQVSKYDIQEKDLCWVDLKGKTLKKQCDSLNPEAPLNIESKHSNLETHQTNIQANLQATKNPSSELDMHLTVYKVQEKAQAVIHAHPPSAIALSLARPQWKYIPLVLPEMIVLMGQVPIVSYATPGTKELGQGLKNFVKKYQAVILSHHGAVVWAENLNKALFLMEQLEQCCKILILAESLGGSKKLPQKEIQKLKSNLNYRDNG